MNKILLLLSKHFYHRPLDFLKILEHFKNYEEILEAPKDAFLKIGIQGKALDNFFAERDSNLEKELEILQKENIGILHFFNDKNYSKPLRNIYDPPPVLFYKGNPELLHQEPLIAVIGSRKMSDYGRRVGEIFLKELAPHFVIVSGLAYGIDGLAHELTLQNKGKTAAVLGSGLDEPNIYPRSNLSLARKIVAEGGLLLSEIPPGVGPLKFHFPMRNRIIAGISDGILIIEAGEKSGTLITARLGLECGADIFAVPRDIFHPNAGGVNFLIKSGAHLVSFPQDILEFYGITVKKEEKRYEAKTDLEKNILANLGSDGIYLDELAEKMGEPHPMELMGALIELEMAGALKKGGEGRYIKL